MQEAALASVQESERRLLRSEKWIDRVQNLQQHVLRVLGKSFVRQA